MEKMKVLEKNSFLKFNKNQVQEVRKSYGFSDEREINEAIDKLDEWVQKQNHFVFRGFSRDYLEAVLLRAKGSMEKAKKRLDKLCTLKTLVPEAFRDLRVQTEFEELNKFILNYCEPTPTEDNYRLVVLKFTQYVPPNAITLINLARLANVCSEYMIQKDFVHGFDSIVDITDLSMTTLLTLANPVMLHKFITVLMDGYGVRIKGIRIVSTSKIVDTFVSLLKQGVGEKVGNRINVYPDYEALAKDVPLKLLPKEFGGSSKSFEELRAGWQAEIFSEAHQKYINEVMSWTTDESKRLSEAFNQEYLGTPGSFRALVVD